MQQVSPTSRDVTLCVINHNGERVLGESVGTAVEQARAVREVVLVDVASEDGSVEVVQARFPDVRIVRLAENTGPGAGRNAGLQAAATDLVLLVDNDVRLVPGSIERLVAALESHPAAAVAMPRVLYAHQPDVVQYDGAGCHYLGLQTLDGEDRPVAGSSSEVRRIGSVVSACILVDRSRLPVGEAFDESFFIYFEDHDFGVRVLAVPEARCLHGSGSAGLSIRALGHYSKKRVFCLIRNRWLFILKNYSARTLFLLAPMLGFYEVAQLAIMTKKGWLGEWSEAAWWIIRHSPQVLAKRRRAQASREVPDRALLEGGPIPFRRELTTSWTERAAKRILDELTAAYWTCVKRLL